MNRLKKVLSTTVLLCSILCVAQLKAQNQVDVPSDSVIEPYPYKLPIWGAKAHERGIKIPKPLGLNGMYVRTQMNLDVTEFGLSINGGPQEINDWLANTINVNTLNFTVVNAYFNGLNFRPDFFLFPFMNVYGIVTTGNGATEVSLAPQIPYGEGEILQLPEFGSKVEFTAEAYGLGTTLFAPFGKRSWVSVDGNYSWTVTELLEDNVGVVTLSGRVGSKWDFKKKSGGYISAYLGFMYRNFTNADGSYGQINLDEVFPEIGDNVYGGIDNRRTENTLRMDSNNVNIEANNDRIDEIEALPPAQQIPLAREKRTLEAKNTALEFHNVLLQSKNDGLNNLESRIVESGVFETQIDYYIKKEMIQSFTVEFGVTIEIIDNFGIRSELGISEYQKLILAGAYYRFGL